MIIDFDLTQRKNLFVAWNDNEEISAHAMAGYID